MDTPPKSKLKIVEEFKSFLLKHGIVGLAIGVVIGAAVGKLVKACVDDLVMPIVGFFAPAGDWRAFKMGVGQLQFAIGDLIGNLIDFVIVATIAFLIIKKFVKDAPPPPALPTKPCPYCLESVIAQAKKCKFCGSEI